MKISRRRFLLSSALVGGGVLIGYSALKPSKHRRANAELVTGEERYVTSFIKIEPNNKITIYVPHSEMGQGVHTSLPMMAADELDAAWEDISVEQAPAIDMFANGDLVTGFAGEFGLPGFLTGIVNASAVTIAELVNLQTTGGSSSVRFTGESSMRTAGAAARQMLVQCAASRWGAAADECSTQLTYVQHNSSGRSLSYGELAADAALLEPPENVTLKDPSQFTIMGKAISRVDIPAKVDGSAAYGIDAQSEDMLYAAIRLAPVFGTKLVSVDAGDVLSRRGVKRIIELEDSVAVVADSYWRAKEALKLVKSEFESSDADTTSSADLFAGFEQSLSEDNNSEAMEVGDTEAAMESASDVIEGNYTVPYLAHAAMEPMNCTVHIHDDIAEVWTSTQDALGIKSRVAKIAGLSEDDAVFHHSYLGGGFGRRLPFNWNVIDHATLIAKEFDVPVKTVMSREDDMQQDYYRPAVASNFQGRLRCERHGASLAQSLHRPGTDTRRLAYPLRNSKSVYSPYVDGDTHVPIAAWRSVDHSQQTFFTESFVDEIAHRAGKNPYQFRMEMLAGHPRHRKVLEVAAEAAGYGQNLPEGHALGIAVQESFGSIVAEVAEVSLDEK